MGISYSARVVIGFKVDKIQKTKSVTKYNENDGSPYARQEPDGYYLQSSESGARLECDGDDGGYFYSGEKYLGFELFESGYEEGQLVLGTEKAQTSDGNGVVEFNDTATNELVELGTKLGVMPAMFLVMSCG